MAVCVQYRGHIGVGNQHKCAPQAVTLQQAPSPCLHWHVKGRIARKPDWFFQCWMSFDPDFPLCGIFAKMLICLSEYTLRNLFLNFRYRFIYFLYVQSAYSARFLCGHTLTDSLITTLSPTNSKNPISWAIATFITQPTKLGDGMLCLIHSDSVYPSVVHSTMSELKFKIALYVKYKTWQCNFSFMSLAATILTFIHKAQPYNSHRLSYWDYYISYTPSISLGRALKFIAMRIIIPWFATHSVFSISWIL